jgi:hypothetical protein
MYCLTSMQKDGHEDSRVHLFAKKIGNFKITDFSVSIGL